MQVTHDSTVRTTIITVAKAELIERFGHCVNRTFDLTSQLVIVPLDHEKFKIEIISNDFAKKQI